MKAKLAHALRRCENPACGILFHPAKAASRFCRVCRGDKKLYQKEATK